MQSARLKYRLISEADAPFLLQLMKTNKWHRYIGDRKIQNEVDAKLYIRSKMGAKLSVKGFVNHLMIDKKTNIAIGTCSLHDREGIVGMDVGYALLPEHEGKGYATEGAAFMVQLAFSKYQQEQISAITTDMNVGSCRVLERLGFIYRSFIRIPHGDENLKLYVLEKKNFLSQTSYS